MYYYIGNNTYWKHRRTNLRIQRRGDNGRERSGDNELDQFFVKKETSDGNEAVTMDGNKVMTMNQIHLFVRRGIKDGKRSGDNGRERSGDNESDPFFCHEGESAARSKRRYGTTYQLKAFNRFEVEEKNRLNMERLTNRPHRPIIKPN